MKLAIATHKGLYLAKYENDNLYLHQIGAGYYYGIGVRNDIMLVGRRIDPYSKDSPTAFEFWNTSGVCIGTAKGIDGDLIQDVHQITGCERGYYICNAYRNSIVFASPDFSHFRELSLNLTEEPNSLINSIYVDGENIWMVQHNRKIRPSEIIWAKHLQNDDFVFCEHFRLSEMGTHNILVHDDFVYYCSSDKGAIRKSNYNDWNTEDWSLKGKVRSFQNILADSLHTKGLAAHIPSNTLIVGVSTEGELTQRFKAPSWLALLDLDGLKLNRVFRMKTSEDENIGNINEIRILD